jgi:hypothetical protein
MEICVQRDLFGNAMSIMVPATWLDTESYMTIIRRPVPDNQEMFVSPHDESTDSKPMVLFVDILESACLECPDAATAPHFHAGELLRRDERNNEADALAPEPPFQVPLSPTVHSDGGEGIEAFGAYFQACDLEVIVVRIPRHTTDIVISLHGRHANGPVTLCPPLAALVGTLHVADWGLFGTGLVSPDDEERLLGS